MRLSKPKASHYKLFLIPLALLFLLLIPVINVAGLPRIGTLFFIMAIFVMSLDVIGGYAGLITFGHAAFYAIGAYASGLLFYYDVVHNYALLFVLGVVAAAVFAAIYGLIALRSRGMYFLLITLALGTLTYAVVFQWRSFTRGEYGIPGFVRPAFLTSTTAFYYFAFAIFIVCFLVLFWLTRSSFGKTLIGIRENEARLNSLGYNVWLFKYLAFIIAGGFAGVAGILNLSYSLHVGVNYASIQQSMSVLLILILGGGGGNLIGPVIGAAVLVGLEHLVGVHISSRWPLFLGALFIVVVMYSFAGGKEKTRQLLRRMGMIRQPMGTGRGTTKS
jgi:branched-chain amino acid transport system permease protein